MAHAVDDSTTAPGLPFVFDGIDSPNGTIFPDVLLDRVMAHLSGAEFKVLAYIVRRTFGFKKDADAISLDQICHGITRRDGSVLDEGTGLTRKTAIAALKGLEEKAVVIVHRRSSPTRGNLPSTFALRFRAAAPLADVASEILDSDEDEQQDAAYLSRVPSPSARSAKNAPREPAPTRGVEKGNPRSDIMTPPRVEERHSRGVVATPGRGTIRHPQQTEQQQTEQTTLVAGSHLADGDMPRSPDGHWNGAQVEALAALVAEGVSTHRALDLCERFAPEVIRQQIEWIDNRRYDDRAGCLVAAIENSYGAPLPSGRRAVTAQQDGTRAGRRQAVAATDPGRYSQGPYGVCPSCGCSPCDPTCPAQHRPATRRGQARE